MTEILMAIEKVPSKFSMVDEGEPPARPSVPPLRRLVRLARCANHLRLRLPESQRRTAQTQAAAW